MKVNKKKWKKFKQSLDDFANVTIQVGAIGDHDNANISNAELLAVHEFGARAGRNKKTIIPARSPVRSGIRGGLNQIQKNFEGLIGKHFNERQGTFDIEKIAEGVGITMSTLIKTAIKKRLSPPNEPSTLKRKKGDIPLIDTQQLVNSIDHRVIL